MVTASISMPSSSVDGFLQHCTKKVYKPRSTIIYAGDNSDCLYYLVDGSVSVAIEDEEGKEIIIAYLNKGAFFGEMGLFENRAPRSAWVHAKTESTIAEISYTKFKEVSAKYPELMVSVGRQMSERLRKTTEKVGTLAFYDVTGRVARTLLDLCKEPDAMTHPDGMQIKITRQEIGRIVGCSREMVGRVLKTLEEQGLVEVHGQTMVVFGTR